MSGQQGAGVVSPQQFATVDGQVLFVGRDINNIEAVWSTAGVVGDAQVLFEFDKPRSRVTSPSAVLPSSPTRTFRRG